VVVARPALQVVGATIFLDGVGMVLMMALQGAGDTRTSAVVAGSCQWLVGLPVALLVGPVLGGGLALVWASQALYRALQAGIFAVIWSRGRWGRAAV
jgi:Na+-driven multidrug efflux pump